jgi:hypothetical protein
MRDIPVELLLKISSFLDDSGLRALATSSQPLCCLLMPEYLRRRGLVLKDTPAGGIGAELHGFGGYASLGLWSAVSTLHPPEDLYCSIPYDAKEARGAIKLLIHFLQRPSNSRSIRSFHMFLRSDPCLIMAGLCRIQSLLHTLPLRELCISGFCSADYLSSPITLRRGSPFGSQTLTSLTISSDHAFTPGLVRATMGILNHSPIKRLSIYMVSLDPSRWSALLGELDMAFLEDIDVEGDIPRLPLIRFLIKHRGLKRICVRGDVVLDRAMPSRSQRQPLFPSLLTLRAPLAICCDVVERATNALNLLGVEVEVDRVHPFDPLFLRLVEGLWRFPKLENFGLRIRPGPQPIMPQESPNDWDGHPACRLTQVRVLSFVQAWGGLSPGDIVCLHLLSLPSLPYSANRT